MEDVLVPIAFFSIIPAIILVAGFWGYKTQKETQETLRRLAEKGESLTPELIRAVGAKPGEKGKYSDLKTGSVLIAVALASVIFGQTIGQVAGEEEPMWFFTGLAAFPGLIGLAYLGFHVFARDKDADA